MLKRRTTCRICGCDLTDVLDLGEHYLAGYISDDTKVVSRKVPLVLTRCDTSKNENACGLVQLRHTTPSYLMYSHYYYQSSINESMVCHLYSLGDKAMEYADIEDNDIIVDIGCNDGTLLAHYKDKAPNAKIVGFDPAHNLLQFSQKSGAVVIPDFFNAKSFGSQFSQKAKLITSIAMFYDLEDPSLFVKDIAEVLDTNGVWVFEQSYLPTMLEQNSFDTIVHEHLLYYSLDVIDGLLTQHGLEVIDVTLNDVNGGSFQVYAGHRGMHTISDEASERVASLRIKEFNMGLDGNKPYEEFADRIEQNSINLTRIFTQAREEGKKILAYGASTKGAITLQKHAGLVPQIEACADRNPRKWGTKIVGSDIPIISEEEARKMKPDYFFVLPWHFMDSFIEREKEFLAGGGKFIVPMPEAKVIP